MSAPAKRRPKAVPRRGVQPTLRRRRITFAGDSPRVTWPKLSPAFLLLEETIFERLQQIAACRGLTYQQLLETILRDHLDDY